LITEEEPSELQPLQIRDQVNASFREKLHTKTPVLASIAVSRVKKNIVLTAAEGYTAAFLQQHCNIWQEYFMFQRMQKEEQWAQVVVHGVPLEKVLLEEGGSQVLKSELETFNSIAVVGSPRWITSKEKRFSTTARFGSIVFAVESEEARQAVLANKTIAIAGVSCKAVKYLQISPKTQCTTCWRFGHAAESCRNRRCRLCTEAHLTKDHPSCGGSNCSITTGKLCKHQQAKCTNCKEAHEANSKDCSIVHAAKSFSN
jgi:hypothetical protein